MIETWKHAANCAVLFFASPLRTCSMYNALLFLSLAMHCVFYCLHNSSIHRMVWHAVYVSRHDGICAAWNDRQRSQNVLFILCVQNTHIIAILMMDGRGDVGIQRFLLFISVLSLSQMPLQYMRMDSIWLMHELLLLSCDFIEHLCLWRLCHPRLLLLLEPLRPAHRNIWHIVTVL